MREIEAAMPVSTIIIPFLGDSGHIDNLIQILQGSNSKLNFKVIFDDRDNQLSRKNFEKLEPFISRTNLIRGNFGSAGAARNAGLSNITTKWFSFCDSDDQLHESTYLQILQDIEKQEIDICVSSFEIISHYGQITDKIIDLRKNQNEIMYGLGKFPGIWRYIFLSSKFSLIRFPELSMGEDQSFLSAVFQSNHPIHFSDRITYRYSIESQNSLTNRKTQLANLEQSIAICRSNIQKGNFSGFQSVIVIRQSFTLIRHGSFSMKVCGAKQLVQFMFQKCAVSFPNKVYFLFRAIM